MKLRGLLSEQEFGAITANDDWAAASIVAFDWLVIAITFVVVGLVPNVLTIVLAIFVLGARQLGLGIIVHETGHRTLFSAAPVNDFVGNWLAGYWVFSNKKTYMQVHLKHHKNAGTEDDPDLNNYRSYPISRASFKRKVFRDLSGQLGWRRLKSIGRSLKKNANLDEQNKAFLQRSMGVNLLLLLVLSSFNAAWLYLLWVAAFMSSHMLVVRIRQIGEHAGVPDNFDSDPRKNTRTVYVNNWERFFIAPHHVSYHLEHHLLASVPIYHLREMHLLLLAKGYYQQVEFPKGYVDLVNKVTKA
ncbi:MAG: fatty acid desaturase [Paraglaciecola psychrophila]|jgi:fatty acid desaturase